jgi:processive 1,2-diacylglycerol beta-glucosyltransferase
MRARSLRQWMELPENAPHWECRVHQALESTHGLYRFGVWLYNAIQKTYPRLHHIYFNILEILGPTRKASQLLGRRGFIALLEEFRPEIVLSTHGHLNHAFFELAGETLGRDRVRCVTYCGELFGGYGFARGWVNPEADAFIGAVEPCCGAAKRLGMTDNKISLGGFLLHPDFYRSPKPDEKTLLFAELNLDPARFTLLLATGANGANNHQACIAAFDRAGLDIQVIALCGKDEEARKRIDTFSPETEGLTVRALAHTGRMPELLRSVSAVLARPGTGTTSEAIVSGCPVLFNAIGGIMPQEGITIRFARDRDLWLATVRRPAELARVVASLDDDRCKAVRERMRHINRDLTPETILRILQWQSLDMK